MNYKLLTKSIFIILIVISIIAMYLWMYKGNNFDVNNIKNTLSDGYKKNYFFDIEWIKDDDNYVSKFQLPLHNVEYKFILNSSKIEVYITSLKQSSKANRLPCARLIHLFDTELIKIIYQKIYPKFSHDVHDFDLLIKDDLFIRYHKEINGDEITTLCSFYYR